MDSIIQATKDCFICRDTRQLHCHHIFYGTANRKLSEQYGLKVWLCAKHHRELHRGDPEDLDPYLKMAAQYEFEKTHTRKEFMEIFGKSYM